MRTAFVRRTVLTASAVSLTLLVTACGGSDKADAKGDAKTSASASATPQAPAAKGKTDAELVGLLVTQAELPGHVLEAVSAEDVKEGAGSTSDKPACLPLIKAQSMDPIGTSTGAARVAAVAKGKEPAADASPEEKLQAGMDALGATATAITLQSYEGKGAAEAFGQLKSAGPACASGYTGTQGGETAKITKVSDGVPVTGGDEALAYTIEMDAEGERLKTELVVVRKGETLAVFSAVSFKGTAEQPTALVAAQLKKLV